MKFDMDVKLLHFLMFSSIWHIYAEYEDLESWICSKNVQSLNKSSFTILPLWVDFQQIVFGGSTNHLFNLSDL